MSGTSLDGLDLASCVFSFESGRWAYKIEAAKTVAYSAVWKKRLAGAMDLTSIELLQLNRDFGRLMSKQVIEFIENLPVAPSLVASHGHTVFHQPANGITLQIGDGAIIAAETGITTVCDFRTLDVALGGQGAPLVPIGDRLLFSNARACLNLGGIANISFEQDGCRLAYDICPCNIPLNQLAGQLGMDYDENGSVAENANIDEALLKALNALSYYSQSFPKSLGMEWIQAQLNPLLLASASSAQDKLRTLVEHIAQQIADATKSLQCEADSEMLITGGGAFNRFLIERIQALVKINVHIPNTETIQFKEALVFAFLGLLRMRGAVNALASVTGAKHDSCGGSVYAGRAGTPNFMETL